MQRIEPKDLYVKYCLNFCMQIRKEGRLKYFTLLKMKAEDVETYSDWLCDCDSLGFDYCLAFVNAKEDNENKYYVCGFSNFELRHDRDSEVLNVTFYENTQDVISEHYFDKWANKADFFLISGYTHFKRKVIERITRTTLETNLLEEFESNGAVKREIPDMPNEVFNSQEFREFIDNCEKLSSEYTD